MLHVIMIIISITKFMIRFIFKFEVSVMSCGYPRMHVLGARGRGGRSAAHYEGRRRGLRETERAREHTGRGGWFAIVSAPLFRGWERHVFPEF